MTDVDTSSYPKLPTTQQNPLDTISKIQGIQRNNIAIDSDKLDLFNKHSNTVKRGLGGLLAIPEGELTFDSVNNQYKKFIDAGIMTPEQYAKEVSSMPTQAGSKSPQEYEGKVRKFLGAQLMQAQETGDMINQFAGKNANVDTGKYNVSGTEGGVVVGPNGLTRKSFEPGSYTRKELPVGKEGFDPNNKPAFEPPGTTPPVTQRIGNPGLPIAPPQSGPAPTAQGGGTNLRPAPSPGFGEGVKGRDEDQLRAKGLSSQNIPALQAYKLIQGLRSGPTTGPWNEAVAALKANHIIPIEANDPTAIYEEANKKLSMIVQAGGTRSDAALAKSEESSPSVKTQINPALVKLTRDLIAQNRTEITLPNEFEGDDFSKYGAHRSTYATKIDQKAAGYDLLPKDEKVKVWKEMKAKKDSAEGKRFFDTLRIMRKHNQFDPESLDQ